MLRWALIILCFGFGFYATVYAQNNFHTFAGVMLLSTAVTSFLKEE
jgi:multisubunit Na+/H+ antiporter MnhC subunit